MQNPTVMKVLRVGTVVFLGVSFVALKVSSAGQIGYSMESAGGNSFVSAGSHPILLVWASLAVGLFALLMNVEGNEVTVGIPTMKRRFVASLIDFWFSLLTLASFGALVPLWLEAVRTGHFAWYFQRNYFVSADGLFAFPIVIATLGMMFLYMVFPLTRGKQSVGYYVMRLRVTPPFGDRGSFTFREAAKRTWYEIHGSLSFLRRLDRDNQGRTWYDRVTNSNVVLIKYE